MQRIADPCSSTQQPPKPIANAKEEIKELDLHKDLSSYMFCPTHRLQPLRLASVAELTSSNGWNSKGSDTNCRSAMAAATAAVMAQRKADILWKCWVVWRIEEAVQHVPKKHLRFNSLVGRSSVRGLRVFCFVFKTGAYSLQITLYYQRYRHMYIPMWPRPVCTAERS